MIIRFIHFLRGSVLLLVSGQFVERFINLCLRRGIFLWDVYKDGDNAARLRMSVRAFKSVRPLARKTHTRIKILEKHGLPIYLAKSRRRLGFYIGILSAVCLLYAASLCIWTVDIAPTERVDESEIRSVLSELGVRPGALKSRIAPREVKDKALLKLSGLSWIWVDVRGARAQVQVLEKRPAPEILSTEPCDIVAGRDGIICEIIATEGQTKVAVGDTVLPGQLLISSVFISERAGVLPRYTHAAGQVFARTWYEKRANAKNTPEDIRRTEAALDKQIQSELFDAGGVRTDARTDILPGADGTCTIIRTAEYKEQIGKQVLIKN